MTSKLEGLVQLLEDLSVAFPTAVPPELDVLVNPLDIFRAALAVLLSETVACDSSDAHKAIQWPNNIFNGDLAVVLPRLRPGSPVDQLAVEIMKEWPSDHPLFPLPFLDGVHLRIFVKPAAMARLLLHYVLDRDHKYGADLQLVETEKQKSVVVEFSSPNIVSEFQGKHLRSTVIGAFISRLYELHGWNVERINYLGDWGKPIALLYVGWTKFGSQEAYDADPVGHLLEVYHQIEAEFQPEQAKSRKARDNAARDGKDEGEAQAEIESKGIFAERNEAFKRLEAGDEELKVFWERVRNVMVADYTSFYERLGVRFSEYSGESQVSANTMAEVEQLLKGKGISEESSGAWMIDMTKIGAKAGHAIVRDRSGSSTYLLRDLAAVYERSREHGFDKMIYVVASDNSVHFSHVLKILEALDKSLAEKLKHIKFSEVSKMAGNLGLGYKPQDILDRCGEAIVTLPEGDAEKAALLGTSKQTLNGLAISALLVQELSSRTSVVHAFDTGAMATFKSGSGPDLQYWYAKVSTLLSGRAVTAALSDDAFEELANEDQANLLRILAQYPEIVKTAYASLEASGIVTYLTSLTEQLSDCVNEEEGEIDVTPGLAALLEASRIVLRNGIELLGLKAIFDLPQERADTPVA
ncbi:arginine--tRNA (Arg) ligase [Parastagonospora nodorum]|nr:arginine--tRNA (Arg) ligase [Parastagonospora nodorum]KAH4168341.1 arginine--tRNA (Arg) ligase [Parastagonospora nodorum]KAH4196653.1 arginine--tRNA (Arg) ligase [Parastagonospora nodorum]KAH4219748.1 arginine--tRNA (Arg) ligase [Parastagonospora nodorum]KAH4241115.1 arginine--tRNA (Arg) ligase [Parastagonospora nodorum]